MVDSFFLGHDDLLLDAINSSMLVLTKQACLPSLLVLSGRMSIPERMASLLAARGIKPRSIKPTLAKTCGISYEAVRQWFAGETGSIKNEHLVAIAKMHKTTVDWLLTGAGDMNATGHQAQPVDASPAPATSMNMSALLKLKGKATPRSLDVLKRIEKAAQEGRLKEADLLALEGIAARFEELNTKQP